MRKSLLLILLVAVFLCMTACTNNAYSTGFTKDNGNVGGAVIPDADAGLGTTNNTIKNPSDKNGDASAETEMTVPEFVDYYTDTEEFEKSREQFSAEGIKLLIEVRGKSIVWRHHYTYKVDDDTLKAEIDSNADSFKKTADARRALLPSLDKMIWEYYNYDGTFITSVEY